MKFMIKVIGILCILCILCIVGCEFVVVPPTEKGKILTTAGYSDDVLPPGKYTLWGRDTLITLQTNTDTYKEPVAVVLADKLTLQAEVRFRGRIAGTKSVINAMFNDIVPGEDNRVSFNEVYRVYGQMVVRNKSREIIGQYSVEDVHKNYSRLSGELGAAVEKALIGTPIEISDISIGNIAYPAVVTQAIDAAKERELAIKKEEAQAEIELTRKKNERLLAEADYQIEITKAKAIRDRNKIMGEGITSQLIRLRQIEALEKMADNERAVFMPVEAMTGAGAQVRMFSK